MTGYATEGWGELFLCAGGATAALSGLIFVGLSVNIRTVLDIDKRAGQNFLTGRGLEALAALLIVLVTSVVALTPAIRPGVLATVILATAAGSTVSPSRAVQASRGKIRAFLVPATASHPAVADRTSGPANTRLS
jgi:modulator of FtsH protease